MADKNAYLEATGQSLNEALHRVIGNTFIVEYGIVKAVPAEGIVTVEMSVAEKANEIIITDCVLAGLSASSMTVYVKPNIDDKVLVLFPRKFHCDMFSKAKNEPILSQATDGYDVLSGIAVPLNQYQKNDHTNSIVFEDGMITVKANKTEIKVDTTGFSITDENGCTIVSTNESIKINNKLEIKK